MLQNSGAVIAVLQYSCLVFLLREALVNSLMARVCLQLLMTARRKPLSASRSIYAKGCNTASVSNCNNPFILQQKHGKKALLTSLQHLATPTSPHQYYLRTALKESLIKSLMKRVCLQLLMIARRKPLSASRSIYAKGCNTASTACRQTIIYSIEGWEKTLR